MNNLYKNKYQIFDGILTKHEENCFENLILNFIPWYFNSSTSSPNGPYSLYEKNDKNVIENFQFTHLYVGYDHQHKVSEKNSEYSNLTLNLLKLFCKKTNLNNVSIVRIKSNLQTQEKNSFEENYTTPHHDFTFDHYVLLYYVNDSDGATVIFDNNNNILEKINPKKGRFLLFDGKLLHSSSSPINCKYRIVINFNLNFN
jgi:hypothetical protein